MCWSAIIFNMEEVNLKIFLSALLGALFGSGLMAAVFYFFFTPEPYVLDLKAIINDEKAGIVQLVETNQLDSKKAADRIENFAKKLDSAISLLKQNKKVILIKDAVISGGEDITDDFREALK